MQYGRLETRYADLATDFGRDWAVKLFGLEAIASLPVRLGDRSGRKALVIWRSAIVTGYYREVGMTLVAGQLADAWIGRGCFGGRSEAMVGLWRGRMQPLALAASSDEDRTLQALEAVRVTADQASAEPSDNN